MRLAQRPPVPEAESATVTVRTVYVGANADLVRGFITTPLERVIASADGIDCTSRVTERPRPLDHQRPVEAELLRRQRALGHQRAREPSPRRLAARSAGPGHQHRAVRRGPRLDVPLVRFDHPRGQPGHRLPDLHVVQPRLSAIEGVQRADILGGRSFAIRAWLKADPHGQRPRREPAQGQRALADNNYLAAVGQTKGASVQLNLTATTDLQSLGEFKKLVVKQQGNSHARAPRGHRRGRPRRADDYDSEVRFSGKKAVFLGIWVLPNANNSVDVIAKVRKRIGWLIREDTSDRHGGLGRLRRDQVHQQRDRRGRAHAARDGKFIVIVVIFLFLGSFRAIARPPRRDPGLASLAPSS